MAVMMAQDKLAKECGFESIIPRLWLGPVSSMSANGAQFVSWDGLWMERARGISLDTLVLSSGVNARNQKVSIRRTAVQDLLTLKCDAPAALAEPRVALR